MGVVFGKSLTVSQDLAIKAAYRKGPLNVHGQIGYCLWWLHALGKVEQFQTQGKNYPLIVPPTWSNKFKLKQEIKTKMDTPGKMHSEPPYHRSHTFVRVGKLPAENDKFGFWPFCLRILIPDYDFNFRGTFRAPTFALSYVTVRKPEVQKY
jgi:hypothetical protein